MDRRRFLQWGTAAIVGTAVLGACTGDDKRNGPPGPPPTTATSSSSSGAGPTDLALAKTAASLEAMLVAAYQDAAASRLMTNSTLVTYTDLFMQHHKAHLAALNGIITTTDGQAAVDAPNEVMESQIVRPALTAAKTQDGLAHLFFTLEDAIAQTYVYAGTAMSRADLRSTMMSIGGIEARHRALLGLSVEHLTLDDLFPSAFARADNPLPPDALIT
ncbi:MAG TPA: ferritin-like domain-containing protein [Acidimicrobiales bacterium]|jgi:hypothetical protein|nr:ferritin-like domain-containing protein [Acidimicrobiales bacterium]